MILFSSGRFIGHQTLEPFHTELYCCSSWRAQLNSDIVYVGVWDALKRQIWRLPEAGSPWWWLSLTLTPSEESLCMLFYSTRRRTVQSGTAHTRHILKSGEILNRVYFTYFINQCIKINKICSGAIWGEWLWFFAGFQLPSLYSFVASSTSLQVVAVPQLFVTWAAKSCARWLPSNPCLFCTLFVRRYFCIVQYEFLYLCLWMI